MADDVEHQGAGWLTVELHEPLHPQQVRAERGLQRRYGLSKTVGIDRFPRGETVSGGLVAVPVDVMGVPVIVRVWP